MLVNKLLQWQKAGYVSVTVWNGIKGMIYKNVLPTDDDLTRDSMSSTVDRKLNTDTSNDPTEPEAEKDDDQQSKLQKSDPVNGLLLLQVADNVFPSMRKQLVLGPMKLGDDEYERLLRRNKKSRERNFEVILLSLHAAKQ